MRGCPGQEGSKRARSNGDIDCSVVIDQERLVEIANRALNVLEMENRLREEIRRGSTLSSQLELEKWERVG